MTKESSRDAFKHGLYSAQSSRPAQTWFEALYLGQDTCPSPAHTHYIALMKRPWVYSETTSTKRSVVVQWWAKLITHEQHWSFNTFSRKWSCELSRIHHGIWCNTSCELWLQSKSIGPSQIQNVLTDNWYWLNLRMNYKTLSDYKIIFKLNLNTVD